MDSRFNRTLVSRNHSAPSGLIPPQPTHACELVDDADPALWPLPALPHGVGPPTGVPAPGGGVVVAKWTAAARPTHAHSAPPGAASHLLQPVDGPTIRADSAPLFSRPEASREHASSVMLSPDFQVTTTMIPVHGAVSSATANTATRITGSGTHYGASQVSAAKPIPRLEPALSRKRFDASGSGGVGRSTATFPQAVYQARHSTAAPPGLDTDMHSAITSYLPVPPPLPLAASTARASAPPLSSWRGPPLEPSSSTYEHARYDGPSHSAHPHGGYGYNHSVFGGRGPGDMSAYPSDPTAAFHLGARVQPWRPPATVRSAYPGDTAYPHAACHDGVDQAHHPLHSYAAIPVATPAPFRSASGYNQPQQQFRYPQPGSIQRGDVTGRNIPWPVHPIHTRPSRSLHSAQRNALPTFSALQLPASGDRQQHMVAMRNDKAPLYDTGYRTHSSGAAFMAKPSHSYPFTTGTGSTAPGEKAGVPKLALPHRRLPTLSVSHAVKDDVTNNPRAEQHSSGDAAHAGAKHDPLVVDSLVAIGARPTLVAQTPVAFNNTSANNVAFALSTGFPAAGIRCVVILRLGGQLITLADLAGTQHSPFRLDASSPHAPGTPTGCAGSSAGAGVGFGDSGSCEDTRTGNDTNRNGNPLAAGGESGAPPGSSRDTQNTRTLSEGEAATLINLAQLHVHMTRNHQVFRGWREILADLYSLHGISQSIKQITNKYRNEMIRLHQDRAIIRQLLEPTHHDDGAIAGPPATTLTARARAILLHHDSTSGAEAVESCAPVSERVAPSPRAGIETVPVPVPAHPTTALGKRGVKDRPLPSPPSGSNKLHGRYNPEEWHRFTEEQVSTLVQLGLSCIHPTGLRRGRRNWSIITAEFNARHGTDVNTQCLQNKLAGVSHRQKLEAKGSSTATSLIDRPSLNSAVSVPARSCALNAGITATATTAVPAHINGKRPRPEPAESTSALHEVEDCEPFAAPLAHPQGLSVSVNAFNTLVATAVLGIGDGVGGHDASQWQDTEGRFEVESDSDSDDDTDASPMMHSGRA